MVSTYFRSRQGGSLLIHRKSYAWVQQVLSFMDKIAVSGLLILLIYTSSGNTQSLIPISLNSAISGSTSGAETGIFNDFSKKDFFTQPFIGKGGQNILQLEVPDEQGKTNLEISTCIGSDFDTFVALLNDNPINTSDAVVISESGNDIACLSGRNKAFLSTSVQPGTYYIVVTGNAAEEGIFNITVIGSKATPTPVPWGLDRIDQRNLPLNSQYSVRQSGENVWIYVVDSGIHASHEEFEGRVQEGYDFVNNERDSAADCTGHGTHVAGIIAGRNFGVAPKSKIISIRVFGCDNKAKSSALIDAIGWILVDSKVKSRENVIVTLMFSTSAGESTILGTTIRGLVRSGIPVIVPAGNNAASTCGFYPGSIDDFLTVGSTDSSDDLSTFSNSGNCTNIYAPGTAITSSWHTSENAYRTLSGTAQAAAHMVGVVANLMSLNSNIKSGTVNNILESISTKNIVGKVPANDTTRFGFVRSVPNFTGKPPPKLRVFLFTVLGVALPACDASSAGISSMRNTITKILSVKASKLTVTCSSGLTRMARVEGKGVELRVEIPERMAASTFAVLEKALGPDKKSTEDSLGYPFTIIEQPWAVDSTPLVFWGAPSFANADSNPLSTGAVAGAVVGALCLVTILVALLWIAYRKVTKLDEVESMEGSADMEKGPVFFDDFGNNDRSDVPRSFRNVVKAMASSTRNSLYGNTVGADRGMNKMGSFIGGPSSLSAKDLVRMASFGGEAFARNDSFKSSMADSDGDGHSSRNLALSFRGLNNLVLNRSRHGRNGDEDSNSSLNEDSMRMQSLGGEAFARIGRQLSLESKTESDTPRSQSVILPFGVADNGVGMRTDSFGAEALASSSHAPREHSFFGGNSANPPT